jgi:hypothetical protein
VNRKSGWEARCKFNHRCPGLRYNNTDKNRPSLRREAGNIGGC